MLDREHLMGQGVAPYPMIAGKPVKFQLPWIDLLEQDDVTAKELKEVVGNGMNTPCLGALLLFMLSQVRLIGATNAHSME